MSKHVYVGMSGGVDSSVTAGLLLEQGYQVTGVFMKNWAQDLPGFKCPWREDLADAKRVAVQLGIPFKIFDFQKEYKQKVVDYMIAGYQAGETPNPDILCNQEVKFKLFLEAALEDGADLIATGHYAKVVRTKAGTELYKASDTNKDQTYFLYRVTENALQKTLFPLGEMQKTEVRKRAEQMGLITAQKKDSVGICFVGEIGIKEFLLNFVEVEPGDVVDNETGKVLGKHDGALFYTIGQRHGLNIGGGMPYYVVGKNIQSNEVFVTTNLNDVVLWQKSFTITNVNWINGEPSGTQLKKWKSLEGGLSVRTRHRAPLVECSIMSVQFRISDSKGLEVSLKHEVRAITPGQSAVLYHGELCLGGGIIV